MAAPGSTLHNATLAAMETALNRALGLDPVAARALEGLEGRVFHLHCTRPELELYLQPIAQRIRLMGLWEGEVTTAVVGRATDFTALASSSDPAATLINGDLLLRGDSSALLRLQAIFAGLEPDWEAPLVEVLGDVAGHQLAELNRELFGWGRQAASSLQRQLREFVVEEAGLVPSRQEVADFYRDLEDFALRLEGLRARVKKLIRRQHP